MPSNKPRKTYFYSYKHFFASYQKELDRDEKECKLDEDQYKSFISDFFIEIMTKIVRENFSFVMPYRLGIIMVKAYKEGKDSLSVNWNETKKQGKLVRYVNDHSFRWSFGILWKKHHMNLRNAKFYNYRAHAKTKRELTKTIRDSSENPLKPSYHRL